MKENSCYTYFAIIGDFNPSEVTTLLNLMPTKIRNKGEVKGSNDAIWQFGLCDKYDVLVKNQMLTTITPLLDKVEILKEFKSKNNVKYYLSIVPTVVANSLAPCLAPSLEIIDFCSQTRSEIDIDLYVI